MIRKWKNKLEADGEAALPGKGHAEDEEVVRLRRELRRVQEENEIRRAISPR